MKTYQERFDKLQSRREDLIEYSDRIENYSNQLKTNTNDFKLLQEEIKANGCGKGFELINSEWTFCLGYKNGEVCPTCQKIINDIEELFK